MYCIGICKLDEDGHFCIGCGRCFDLDECTSCLGSNKYKEIQDVEDV
jgi:rRNA maturation endonuclease Nob1